MARGYKWTDSQIVAWADSYVYEDFTLFGLEEFLGIQHSTIWWCFMNRLEDINPDLYDLVVKRIAINNQIGGRRKVNGKTVITSKQSIELPKSLRYEEKEVKKNMIIWRFRTEDEAIRAAKTFMNRGFEVVRRPV